MAEDIIRRERSPGMKLLLAALVGLALMVPLMMVYWLVYDRQEQSTTAQTAINATMKALQPAPVSTGARPGRSTFGASGSGLMLRRSGPSSRRCLAGASG